MHKVTSPFPCTWMQPRRGFRIQDSGFRFRVQGLGAEHKYETAAARAVILEAVKKKRSESCYPGGSKTKNAVARAVILLALETQQAGG